MAEVMSIRQCLIAHVSQREREERRGRKKFSSLTLYILPLVRWRGSEEDEEEDLQIRTKGSVASTNAVYVRTGCC